MWVVWNCSQGCNTGGAPNFNICLSWRRWEGKHIHEQMLATFVPESSLGRLFTWPCRIFSFILSSSENPGRVDWESYLISLNKDSEAQRGKGISPLLTRRNRKVSLSFWKLSKEELQLSVPWFIFESNLSGKSCWAINDLYKWKPNPQLPATLFDTAILTS